MRQAKFIFYLMIFSSSRGISASGWFASDQVWGIIYLLCAGYGALILNYLLKMPYFSAFSTTFCIALFKEIGDSLYAHGIFGEASSGHPFWDARGLSESDLLMVLFSVLLSYPFRKK